MARVVYPKFRPITLSPGVDLLTANLKAALVSTTTGASGENYTYDAAHEFLSSVPAAALLAPAVALTGKSLSGSSLLASSVVFPSVAVNGSKTGQALIYFIDTGDRATSRLVGYSDVETGLPVTPNGQNITVAFSSFVITQA